VKEMRRLGKTNIVVNEIGLGGIPIQRGDSNTVHDILSEMISRGLNVIDTARGYTVSEEYLGQALKGRRHKFVLFTKSMARTYDAMKQDIKTSLNNLQTNYIDLYQCHNLKATDDYSGAIRALKEAKESGLIGHIGVTSHSFDFLMSIIDNTEFETIQFPYNIIEPIAEVLFEKAKARDIGVIVMKPLAGGAIDNGQIALKFILNNESVSVAIPGMGSAEEVIKNSSVKPGTFTNDELIYIDQIRNELNEDFCRRCGYCLPCTEGIDIPSCFLFEGYYKRYNLKVWAKERYNSLVVKPDKCIACGKCEKRCPYNLKIIEKLKRVKELLHD
jgi:predicted aldo/keto reductase-like oxidoreductase